MLKSYFFFFLFFAVNFPILGQVYDFQSINQEDGLPSSTINVVYQDSRDFIWIGTDGGGLVKYDGINYEILNKKNGLLGEFITDVVEDANSNMVIATRYSGIYIFSGKKIVKIFNMTSGITSNLVYKLINTKEGILAVTHNEVVRISPQYQIKTIFQSKNSYDIVNSFVELSPNQYLLATNNGLLTLNNAQISPFFPSDIKGKTTLFKDNRNRIFIGTDAAQLFVLEDNKLSAPTIIKTGYGKNFPIKNVFVAKSGNVWMSSDEEDGICFKAGDFYSFFDKTNGFNGENITTFYQDKTKNLYIGTYGNGLYKTFAQQFIGFGNIQHLNDSNIFSIVKKEDKIYVSVKKKGAYEFRFNETDDIRLLRKFPIEDAFTSFINQDKQVVFGTNRGITIIDDHSSKNINLQHLIHNELFKIRSLYQDAKGRYFIGTHGNGLFILDKNYKLLHRIDGKTSPFFEDNISTIFEVAPNRWYLGCSSGLYLMKEEKGIFYFSKNH